MYAFIKPILGLKSIKTICHLIQLLMESSKIYVLFFDPNYCIRVLRAFIYNVVNIKMIVILFHTKPPSYSLGQVTRPLKLCIS